MESDALRLGRYGSIWCKDTVAYTAPTGTFFCAFYFTEASVFTSLGVAAVAVPGSAAAPNTNCTFASASSTLASMTFPAGSYLYGMWSSWTLASGGLVAYKIASKWYQPG